MARASNRGLLRALVRAFPPLKLALAVNDFICNLLNKLVSAVYFLAQRSFQTVYGLTRKLFNRVSRLVWAPPSDAAGQRYSRLNKIKRHKEPVPYRADLIRRSLTYHGGLLLGLVLYVFVYFVLVKEHSYASVAVAFVLMLVYLLVLENSHNIRSILMLCLPIMFTNRGRALVFCSMLTLLVAGPVRNTQTNIRELHSSLNCCKQFLILKADKYVDDKIIGKVVRLEDAIVSIMDTVKQFVREMKQKIGGIIELALQVERQIANAIERLKRIVNVCNLNKDELLASCQATFARIYKKCRTDYWILFEEYCRIILPLGHLCKTVEFPGLVCRLPSAIVDLIDATVGERLRYYAALIENEFYVDVDIDYRFYYNETKSKSYRQVAREINLDIEQKFWYVRLVARVFNLLSLILVVWILVVATLYHMHYTTELSYDNMYLDGHLKEIDEDRRRRDALRELSRGATVAQQAGRREISARSSDDEVDLLNLNSLEDVVSVRSADLEDDYRDEPPKSRNKQRQATSDASQVSLYKDDVVGHELEEDLRPVQDNVYLFPMSATHERKYLRPFSCGMNQVEREKLYVSGFIWLVIMGYIFFFVALDYALFSLIELTEQTLREVLFTSDLPLIDLESRNADKIVRYNRTYLAEWRKSQASRLNATIERADNEASKPRASAVRAFYRRLADRIEQSIPDEVAILDSLERCLPRASSPMYGTYKTLVFLAVFTFGAVIVEAYALRTRHCIANLYFPRRAKRRAIWLYSKLMGEKGKYQDDAIEEELVRNIKLFKDRNGRR